MESWQNCRLPHWMRGMKRGHSLSLELLGKLEGHPGITEEQIREAQLALAADPGWERVAAIDIEVSRRVLPFVRKSNRALAEWAADVSHAIGRPDASAIILRVVRASCRDRGPSPKGDFISPVYIDKLIAAAEEHELAGLASDENDTIDQIAERYANDLDRLIVTSVDDGWKRRINGRPQYDPPGTVAFEDRAKVVAKYWKSRFTISNRAASDIGAVLRNCGRDQDASEWEERYLRALCPDTMRSRWPSQMLSWLRQSSSPTPEQVEAVSLIQDEFEQRYRRQVDAVVVAAEGRFSDRHGPDPSRQSFRRFVSALWELHVISRVAVGRLASVLSGEQCQVLAQALSPNRRFDPELMGPPPLAQREGGDRCHTKRTTSRPIPILRRRLSQASVE